MVPSLEDAVALRQRRHADHRHVPVARKTELRDRLASAGAQRVCRVGTAEHARSGRTARRNVRPQRFVHWMGDDDIDTASTPVSGDTHWTT